MFLGVADVPSMVKKLKKKAWLIAGPTGEDSMLQSLSQLEFPAYGFEVIFFFYNTVTAEIVIFQYAQIRSTNFGTTMVLIKVPNGPKVKG